MARPRTGSSTFIASNAPATAPKKEAAHARNGVSSHPKMRNSIRTQRIRSGATLPHRGKNRSEHQAREEGYTEGSERPARSRKAQHNRQSPQQDREREGRYETSTGRRLSVPLRLIRED